MARGRQDDKPDPTPLELGRAAASQLGGDWQLDAETEVRDQRSEVREEPGSPPLPSLTSDRCPLTSGDAPRPPEATPPTPEQLVEAMLFVGGHPLTAEVACSAVRGLTPDRFRAAID